MAEIGKPSASPTKIMDAVTIANSGTGASDKFRVVQMQNASLEWDSTPVGSTDLDIRVRFYPTEDPSTAVNFADGDDDMSLIIDGNTSNNGVVSLALPFFNGYIDFLVTNNDAANTVVSLYLHFN